jgi:hypothetical protein
MKLRIWGIAALAACLLSIQAVVLQAREQEQLAAPTEDLGPLEADSGGYGAVEHPGAAFDGAYEDGGYDSFSAGSCPCDLGCNSGCGGGGMLGLVNRPMQFVMGAEYIYAQATFSDALAYVERDPVAGGETWHQLDFDYQSSYSVYGGLYFCDCGGAVLFDYTRLNSRANYEAAFSSDVFVPFEVIGPNDGVIRGGADVQINSYDLSFAKTIPLGCLQTCGADCGDCCDPCCSDCCTPCPAWDITWSGGIRYANVGWTNGAAGYNGADGSFNNAAYTTLDFDGFGGRVGIMGRRYFGCRGLFSAYARGDWSILYGQCDIETISIDSIVPGPIAFARKGNNLTVPVTEIELGGSAHLGAHATLSAGWFWSAWHDLGMSQTYDFEQAGANVFQTAMYDDANILGFNGFFARAEVAF